MEKDKKYDGRLRVMETNLYKEEIGEACSSSSSSWSIHENTKNVSLPSVTMYPLRAPPPPHSGILLYTNECLIRSFLFSVDCFPVDALSYRFTCCNSQLENGKSNLAADRDDDDETKETHPLWIRYGRLSCFSTKILTFWNDADFSSSSLFKFFFFFNFVLFFQSGTYQHRQTRERERESSWTAHASKSPNRFYFFFRDVGWGKIPSFFVLLLFLPEKGLVPASCLWYGWVPRRDPFLLWLAPKGHSRWYQPNVV